MPRRVRLNRDDPTKTGEFATHGSAPFVGLVKGDVEVDAPNGCVYGDPVYPETEGVVGFQGPAPVYNQTATRRGWHGFRAVMGGDKDSGPGGKAPSGTGGALYGRGNRSGE